MLIKELKTSLRAHNKGLPDCTHNANYNLVMGLGTVVGRAACQNVASIKYLNSNAKIKWRDILEYCKHTAITLRP